MIEFLIFALLVVFVVLLSGIKSELRKQSQEIRYELMGLRHQLDDLEKKNFTAAPGTTPNTESKSTAPVADDIMIPPAAIIRDVTPAPVPVPEPEPDFQPGIQREPEVVPVAEVQPEPEPVLTDHFEPVALPVEQEAELSFMERNPDLEKFIGENLINKVGIAILVLGIGFFVKYAIDKDWIHESGRMLIGILAGTILIGIAHRMREKYRAFSSVLVGGGIAVYYFTIAISFHEYHLLSQAAAFASMVLITAFAVLLSVYYNRKELIVLSVIGGFAAPFMVSTGEGNYKVLFTYLAILNSGMLLLAFYKRWDIVKILCYIFTILIFGVWVVNSMGDTEGSNSWGLFFGSLFYLIFLTTSLIPLFKEDSEMKARDYLFILSNTMLIFAVGMQALYDTQWKGIFTAALATFNFALTYSLYRRQRIDRNLIYLMLGIVLTLVSLVGPLQLKGSHITLFWAAEAPMLLWFSRQAQMRLIRYFAVPVLALMLISLGMDWLAVYRSTAELPLLINKGFTTGLFVCVSVYLCNWLLGKETDEEFSNGFPMRYVRRGLQFAFTILVYITALLELNHHLSHYCQTTAQLQTLLAIYHFAWVAALGAIAMRTQSKTRMYVAMLLAVVVTLAYIVGYERQFVHLRNAYLEGQSTDNWIYPMHFISIILLGCILVQTKRMFYQTFQRLDERNIFRWMLAFVSVFVVSAEVDQVVITATWSPGRLIESMAGQNHKIAFPILWGICSFVFMYVGMKFKARMWRIISLVLFALTLLKLFVFDLRGISEGGKIAAFISLGILLLVVSFMYQKLKVLILDDEADETKKETEHVEQVL